jgi:catechol 2,3-dioxygenase-like lactoylglutathione lyase family enzyme
MMQLSIVSVPVSDQERAKDFYCRVLGFKVVREQDMGSAYRWVQLKPPSGSAGISLVTWFDSMLPGSAQGLVLETMDIEHVHDKLREAGLAITDVQTADWGRFATFFDPDGNGWVLAMPALES